MTSDAPVLWWCRRDLRVDDNPALHAALQTGRPVVPIFVWAPEEDGQFQQGRYSRWWTKQSVGVFQRQLELLGSRLVLRRATETLQALLRVVQETGASSVFFNHLYDPISLVRDHEVKAALAKIGVECRGFNGDLLYEPWEVLNAQAQPYTSFATFWAGVMAMPSPPPLPLPAPAALPPVDASLSSLWLSELDWFMTPEQESSSEQLKFKWQPGVQGAVERLEAFLHGRLPSYEHDRAKVDRGSTSQLSPWVHIGTLSVRYIFYRVCQRQAELRQQAQAAQAQAPSLLGAQAWWARSAEDFLQQLGYREYSRYLAFHFPFMHERTLLAHLRACPWRIDQPHFKAWRTGQTGYPLVDAAMRELWSTGWCHNRMRVVAASFMVKNLLLPWQWGLKHYWDAQIDADLECDALGWQYVSGGMSDAHPFSYMMDLESEALRFDPDGEYVRRWLPVLARLPTRYIHTPWKAPAEALAAADVELGFNYPERVITAEESRAHMAHACKMLEMAAALPPLLSSGGGGAQQQQQQQSTSQLHPYSAPTLPLSSALNQLPGGTGTGGASNFGNGTGTGSGTTFLLRGEGPGSCQAPGAAGGADKAQQEQQQQPLQWRRQHGLGGGGGTGSSEPTALGFQAAGLLAGVPEHLQAAASHHAAPKLTKEQRRWQRRQRHARPAEGVVCHDGWVVATARADQGVEGAARSSGQSDEDMCENEDMMNGKGLRVDGLAAVGQPWHMEDEDACGQISASARAAGAERGVVAAAEGDNEVEDEGEGEEETDEEEEEDVLSEEVVSNTVGLSACQPSAASGWQHAPCGTAAAAVAAAVGQLQRRVLTGRCGGGGGHDQEEVSGAQGLGAVAAPEGAGLMVVEPCGAADKTAVAQQQQQAGHKRQRSGVADRQGEGLEEGEGVL